MANPGRIDNETIEDCYLQAQCCTKAAEQASDLCDVFPEMNRQEKMSSLGGQSTPLLQRIEKGFGRLHAEYGLTLATKKKKTLAEFFVRFPKMASHACIKDKIRSVF
jgi:hypothetical protein